MISPAFLKYDDSNLQKDNNFYDFKKYNECVFCKSKRLKRKKQNLKEIFI